MHAVVDAAAELFSGPAHIAASGGWYYR